jgi:uncharacterized hydrophobic protein (TIGR00271 family)
MRHILMEVPVEHADAVVRQVKEMNGLNCATSRAQVDGQDVAQINADMPNRQLGELLEHFEHKIEMRVSFIPSSTFALRPPPEKTPDEVTDLSWRSPQEIYLNGLQSLGSWRGFLTYSVVAGAVVWIGLLTGTIYLLTAAMLIAPFAGPAMNAAVGAASGDSRLLVRSIIRYVVSLSITIVTCWLLSILFGHDTATQQMISGSSLSAVALLLPLSAGIAGALHLVQSERASLVSGAGVGILVAASLAPPAGVVGMALAIGRYGMALDSAWLLVLQLFGIHLSAGLVFRLAGLAGGGARQRTSRFPVFPVSLTVSLLGIAALLLVQFTNPISMQRSTVARAAASETEKVISARESVIAVNVTAEFARHALLLFVRASVAAPPGLDRATLKDELSADIRRALQDQWRSAVPVIDLTVLDLPPRTARKEGAPLEPPPGAPASVQ